MSRLVGRLRADFETWRSRDLATEDIRYLFLDGWYPKVRIGRRRVRVPVVVTLGVRASGERIVLDLRLAGDESAASWDDVIAHLVTRHLRPPVRAVIDGNPGLHAQLTTDQFARHLDNSFPSIRDTIVHLYAADWGWHLLWQGQMPTDPPPAASFPDLASIETAWQDQERKVRGVVENLPEADVGGF